MIKINFKLIGFKGEEIFDFPSKSFFCVLKPKTLKIFAEMLVYVYLMLNSPDCTVTLGDSIQKFYLSQQLGCKVYLYFDKSPDRLKILSKSGLALKFWVTLK